MNYYKLTKTLRLQQRIMLLLILMLSLCLSVGAKVRLYDADQLSSNLITSICQDGVGYMWISTEYGLNAFDGIRFSHYFHHADDPLSVGSDHVVKVFSDKDGRAWMLSYGTVQRYDMYTNHFERVSFDGTVSNFKDICQRSDGRLLVLTGQGVMEVDRKTMKGRPMTEVNKLLPDDNSKFIYIDKKGRLWVASDHQVMMYDQRQHKGAIHDEELRPYGSLSGICEDENGHLIVVANNCVLRLNEANGNLEQVMSIPGELSVRRVYRNSRGEVLVGSFGKGMHRLNLEHGTAEDVYQWTDEQNPWQQQSVYAFCEDRDGNSWVGCYKTGLAFLAGKSDDFHYMDLHKSAFAGGKPLTTAFADRKGNYFIGIEEGGIYEVDDQGHPLRHFLPGITVITAYDDGHGRFWVSNRWNGLLLLDQQSGKTTPLVSRGRVTSIVADKQGNIYAAFANDSILSWNVATLQQRQLCKGKIPLRNKQMNVLYPNSKGQLWIGHYNGIDIYDPSSDRMLDVTADSMLWRTAVFAIAEGADGRMWIGTNKGLFCYDKHQQWQHYTTCDGLPSDFVCGIVEDDSRQLWISTYHGLSRMDPSVSGKPRFVNYYRGNGLETNQYMRAVYGRSPYGQVYFGGSHGFTWFTPKEIRKNEFQRGITLTAIEENGEMMPPYGDLRFGYDSSFTLYFSPMDYREMENVYYEYRFASEPSDVWHRLQPGGSQLSFIHLASGSYELQVRACDNGVYSPIKEFSLRVTPPWWRSWLAYLIYLIVAAGIAFWAWQYYRRHEEAEANEAKIRFFVDISHELRSPLTLIKSPLDMLLKRTDFDAQTVRALMNMSRNTDRLLTLVNQILSIRKIEKGQMKLSYAETDLNPFVENLVHAFDLQAEKRKIGLTFHAADEPLTAWIDRDWFNKIINNLIGNALKYVEDGGEVTVEVRSEKEEVRVMVTDNGPGIDETQLKRVFERFYQTSARPAAGQMGYGIGLNLAYKIARQHGGIIEAANRTDGQHGSVFTVTIPTGNSHLKIEELSVERENLATASEGNIEGTAEANISLPKERKPRKKTSYRVVVVDDDEEIRQFLQTELSYTYHVSTFADGQQALEAISIEQPDLVISDVVMPVMDGLQLLHRLKNNTRTSHIPVILLTTKTEHQSRIAGLDEGADAYMDKPFNLEELEARTAGLIANRQRMKGKFSGIQEQQGMVKEIELKGNDEQLMERIMKVVNERLTDEDFNVEALVDAVGLSRAQFHRRMKEMTGLSPAEFIRNLRMQQAAKLLEKGDVSVAQVTYAIGMSNPNHFTAAFRKYFGVSPTEYMAKHSGATKS